MPPLTGVLLLLAAVLIGIALLQRPVQGGPLSTALVYLAVGALAGAIFGAPVDPADPHAAEPLVVITEAVVLVSLFTVGLRLRRLAWPAWRLAFALAGSGMLLTVALAAAAAAWLLGLPWAGALVLAAMLAPTDPVLASEVQVRGPKDRDTVRFSLTAEGGLNDATALPIMLLALGLLGAHELGAWGWRWLAVDLLWAIGGGAAIGWGLGRGLDWTLRRLLARGHPLVWDELLYAGAIALGYGVARLTATSAFLVVFACGVALFWRGERLPDTKPPAEDEREAHGETTPDPLDERMVAFGSRCERLLEVFMVLALGAVLAAQRPSAEAIGYALLFIVVLRPLAVSLLLRGRGLSITQQWLIAWFGVRGVGSLFYLAFALAHGLPGPLAAPIVETCLWTVALSIALHGVSATPLMNWYQSRRKGPRGPPA